MGELPATPSEPQPRDRPADEPANAAAPAELKERLAAFYSRVAPLYAEQGPPRFACAGRRLVEITGVSEGDAVLDLACGRGAVLFPAVRRVGEHGHVVGIDLAPGMVERTRAAIAERGIQTADVRLMDAERLAFGDGSFTHVLCSYAVFFFSDLATVLAEVRRVLGPSGRLGFAFERRGDPRWAWYEELLRAHGALDDLPPMPSNEASRHEGALAGALAAAGFVDARERVEEVELGYPDAETWWHSLWTHGSRRPLERLSEEHIAELRAACLDRARALAGPDGLHERHQFVFVTGRRPEV